MSILLNYNELFEPYTTDGHTLEGAVKYLTKLAMQHNIATECVELAVNEVFNKVANGYEYPKDKCPCGCGIDKAGTAITHAMRDRLLEIDKERTTLVTALMQSRYENVIYDQIRRINVADKEYVKLNRPSLSERSPVLRFLKRAFS